VIESIIADAEIHRDRDVSKDASLIKAEEVD
jgi:hypothetical protein